MTWTVGLGLSISKVLIVIKADQKRTSYFYSLLSEQAHILLQRLLDQILMWNNATDWIKILRFRSKFQHFTNNWWSKAFICHYFVIQDIKATCGAYVLKMLYWLYFQIANFKNIWILAFIPTLSSMHPPSSLSPPNNFNNLYHLLSMI